MTIEEEIEIEEGQFYEHVRGDFYEIEHVNEDIVLLFDGNNYRMENVEYFRSCLESAMFEYRPDFKVNDSTERVPFEEIDWVGEEGISSLEDADLTTPKKLSYITDERLLKLNAIGQKGVDNIREWVEGGEDRSVEL